MGSRSVFFVMCQMGLNCKLCLCYLTIFMYHIRCLEDLPSRVLDLLKTFLAASSRGETAVLVLETKKKAVNTKYRSVDTEVGSPAPLTNTSRRKRKNPARARKSQLRLEAFRAKKSEEQARLEHQQCCWNLHQ